MVRVFCDFCGKSISKPRKLADRHEHHFCNNECRIKWLSNGQSKADNINCMLAIIEHKQPTTFKDISEYVVLAMQTLRTYGRELMRENVLKKDIGKGNQYFLSINQRKFTPMRK